MRTHHHRSTVTAPTRTLCPTFPTTSKQFLWMIVLKNKIKCLLLEYKYTHIYLINIRKLKTQGGVVRPGIAKISLTPHPEEPW